MVVVKNPEDITHMMELWASWKPMIVWLIAASAIAALVQLGWLWSIATEMQRYLPEGMTMKIKRFKVLFVVPLLYLPLLGVIFIPFIQDLFQLIGESPSLPESVMQDKMMGLFKWFPLIFVSHIFVVFCAFHTIYFAAKALRSAQLGKRAKTGQYFEDFILLWFYPIGVWFVQPRIQQIIENASHTSAENNGSAFVDVDRP